MVEGFSDDWVEGFIDFLLVHEGLDFVSDYGFLFLCVGVANPEKF